MRKYLFLLIILSKLLFSESIYFYEKDIPYGSDARSEYRVKIAAFKSYKNAKQVQSNIKNSYILKGKKYYSLYIGRYSSKDKAYIQLNKIIKDYPFAYIVKTFYVPKTNTVKSKGQYIDIKKADKFFKQGDYESALAEYDKVMIMHPDMPLAVLGYAKTLYALGFYKQAKVEFSKVLALNPPKNVQKNINIFIDKIDKKLRKNSFFGSIDISYSYDDNLGYAPSDATILYGGVELENNTTKVDGFYTNLNILLSHLYESDSFLWINTLYLYNEFQGENSISDLNFANFTTSFLKKYGYFNISLPIGASYTWLDQEGDNYALFTLPNIRYNLSQSTNFTLGMKYYHSYNILNTDRSYDTTGATLSFQKLYYSRFKTRVTFGYDNDKKVEGSRYDISKETLHGVGFASYELLKNSILSLKYHYLKSRYSDIDPALGYHREDIRDMLVFGLSQQFKSNILSFSYTVLNNDSNVNSYSYKKNSYSINYNYNF